MDPGTKSAKSSTADLDRTIHITVRRNLPAETNLSWRRLQSLTTGKDVPRCFFVGPSIEIPGNMPALRLPGRESYDARFELAKPLLPPAMITGLIARAAFD